VQALTVAGQLDSLAALRDYVRQAAAEAGLDSKPTYQLVLAVDEVATNIITHGYEESGRSGEVTIRADVETTSLKITLEDSGVQFDPRKRPDPTNLDDPLETRAIGGLGIYLTVHGVDRFDYAWQDGKNYNVFVMNRPDV
jgi:anti-sigma regulatory factor (Ser/Thr protein kinase)